MGFGLRAMNAAAILAALPVPTLARSMPPIDECLRIDGYYELRQQLGTIARARDAAGLLALISPTIEWNFGGEPATRVAFD